MTLPQGVFKELSAISPEGARWLDARLSRHGLFETTADEFAADANLAPDQALRLLELLVRSEILEQYLALECPCGELMAQDAVECSHCGRGVDEATSVQVFRCVQPRGRDVAWVLLIHGMNTTGGWQEQFAWRAALTYGRSVPVFSYKYGQLRPGVLFGRRRSSLVTRTVNSIRELSGDAASAHLGGPPDVISHSFGTWLVVHALLADRDLQIGRLILTGGIVPPDFDWSSVEGQVEAVLNHRASRDRVVPLAPYFIPDSGPSGKYPFDRGDVVLDLVTDGWGHSDFFSTENLASSFEEVWKPFLTVPSPAAKTHPAGTWKPPAYLLRARALRWLAIGLLAAAFCLAAYVVFAGVQSLI
jgi:hypothetical protein